MKIIKCPYCTLYGERRNLAEVIPGGLKIMRRSDEGTVEYTIVMTNDYSVVCSTCGHTATYKQPEVKPVPGTMTVTWGTLLAFYADNSPFW